VRHLTDDADREFLQAGFVPVERYPWMPQSPAEDETWSHRLVVLADSPWECLQSQPQQRRPPQPPGQRALRLAVQRFSNFLARNGLSWSLRPLAEGDLPVAARLVREHYAAQDKLLAAADCEILFREPLADGGRYVSLLGWLRSPRAEVPACVFLGERTGKVSGALYLNVARRDRAVLEQLGCCDAAGFSAISAFFHAQLFARLIARGWLTLDLGGSETASLDRFKQTLGAATLVSKWVALTRAEL
jgi:hypothetical protein